MKFKQLESVNPGLRSSVFRMPLSDTRCWAFRVAYAGPDNASYWADFTARNTKFDEVISRARKKKGKRSKADEEKLAAEVQRAFLQSWTDEDNSIAYALFPKHVILDWWEEVTSDDGEVTTGPIEAEDDDGNVGPVECNEENARAMLEQMPSRVLAALKAWVKDENNFYEDAPDAEALSGN